LENFHQFTKSKKFSADNAKSIGMKIIVSKFFTLHASKKTKTTQIRGKDSNSYSKCNRNKNKKNKIKTHSNQTYNFICKVKN
jgi:hypothetical protein